MFAKAVRCGVLAEIVLTVAHTAVKKNKKIQWYIETLVSRYYRSADIPCNPRAELSKYRALYWYRPVRSLFLFPLLFFFLSLHLVAERALGFWQGRGRRLPFNTRQYETVTSEISFFEPTQHTLICHTHSLALY